MIIERIPVRVPDAALLLPAGRGDHAVAEHGVTVLAIGPTPDVTGPGPDEVAIGFWCAPMDMRLVPRDRVTRLHALTRVACWGCRRSARHYPVRAAKVSAPDGPLAALPPAIIDGPAL